MSKKDKRGETMNHTDEPAWLHDRLQWFRDQKLGLFMHWGIYSVWGICESWPLVPADTWARPDTMKPWADRNRDLERFSADYRALNREFNPTRFDPHAWAEAAEGAGMKYVCFTTKHHDGFCMFDTRTTDYRVTHPSCPFAANPRSNIAKEVFDAFRARDFGVWCYFSKSDWHTPFYWSPDFPVVDRNPNYDTAAHPEIWERFVGYTHEQIRELLTDYGPIDVLWLDGGQVRPPKQDIRMDEIAGLGRRLQPGLIIADRTVGGRHENFITPEQTVPDEPIEYPWESCVTMGTSFSYRFDEQYKSTRSLIHLLVDIVAKGGNLLLNVAPSPEGVFDDIALGRLREIGDWMRVNGEAIYGTRPVAPFKKGSVCFTKKADTVYAVVPAEGDADAPPQTVAVPRTLVEPNAALRMLGHDEAIQSRVAGENIVVSMPRSGLPCEHAWVLAVSPTATTRRRAPTQPESPGDPPG